MTDVDKALLEVSGAYDRVCAAAGIFAFLWGGICVLLALIGADTVFQLGAWARLTLDGIGLLAVCGWAVHLLRRSQRERRGARGLAMLMERQHGDLDNALINAVEFEDMLAAGGVGMSVGMMREEISRAAARVRGISPADCVPRERMARERRMLLAVVLIAAVVLALFPSLLIAVAPRYLDPFGDHPPFSLTTFDVEPKGARIFYGDALTVRATLGGRIPKDPVLVTVGEDGAEERTALIRGEPGRYSQRIDGARADLTYYAAAGRGRSKKYRLEVILAPQFRQVLATLEWPEYTRIPPQTAPVGAEGIVGLRGTRVKLEVTSNRPLAGGKIVLEPRTAYGDQGEPLKGSEEGGVRVTGEFEMRETGSFALSLKDVAGVRSREEFKRPIRVLEDKPPTVSFISPGPAAMATPDSSVPVVLEVEDDYGVERYDLYRSVNNAPATREAAGVAGPPPKALRRTVTFDLKKFGVKPGDVVEYRATAYDNYPGGPHAADTKVQKIQVISLEEYQRAAREQQDVDDLVGKYESLSGGVRALAEAQKELAKQVSDLQKASAKQGRAQDGPAQEKLKALLERAEALRQEAERRADQIEQMVETPPLYDAEKAFQERLAEAARELRATAKEEMQEGGEEMRKAQTCDGPQRSETLSQAAAAEHRAADRLGQAAEGMERSVNQPMERLGRLLRLCADAERFRDLADQQGDLVKRMAQSQGKEPQNASDADRQAMQGLAKEQEGIRNGLADLEQKLREHGTAAGEVSEDLSRAAKGLAEGIEEKGIEPAMSDAAKSLERSEGAKGHESGRQAKEKMEELSQSCEACRVGGPKCPLRGDRVETAVGMEKGQMGSTLEQFRAAQCRACREGRGTGAGRGEGASGRDGTSSNLPLFGPNSPLGGESSVGVSRETTPEDRPEGPAALAGNQTESVLVPKTNVQFTTAPAEAYADEYKKLVEDYFKLVAEEEGK